MVPTNPVDLSVPFNGLPSISQSMVFLDKGKIVKRNLMIWDEGLIASEIRTVELTSLKAEGEAMVIAYSNSNGSFQNTQVAIGDAIAWVTECVEVSR